MKNLQQLQRRRRTTDKLWSEKLTWAFISGEQKKKTLKGTKNKQLTGNNGYLSIGFVRKSHNYCISTDYPIKITINQQWQRNRLNYNLLIHSNQSVDIDNNKQLYRGIQRSLPDPFSKVLQCTCVESIFYCLFRSNSLTLRTPLNQQPPQIF